MATTAIPSAAPMELEHAIGFSGALRSSVHVLPGTSKYLFVAGGCVVVADIENPHEQTFIRGHDEDIVCLHLSESGKFFVTGQRGRNCDVCLWSAESFSVVARFAEHEGSVLQCDISPDDSIVASIGAERRLAFFDTSNGGMITHTPLLNVLGPTEEIRAAVFGGRVQDVKRRDTECFHHCVVTSSNVILHHLNPVQATLTRVRVDLTSYQRAYSAARYSAFGDLLFVGSDSGDVAIINTQTGTVVAVARVCALGVREIELLGTHMRTAAATDTATGFQYARFGPNSVRSTTFFVGGGDGSIVECCVEDHAQPAIQLRCKRLVNAPISSLSLLSSSKSAHVLLTGTTSGTLLLVEASVSQSANPEDHIKHVSDAVAAGYDLIVPHPSAPELFVTASNDGMLRLWNLNDYRCTGVFESQTETRENVAHIRCTAICISDGLDIQLSAWSDGCIRCHDMTNCALLWVHARAHRCGVTALCLSPSASFFVTGSEEGEIKVWDTRTRELRAELKDHRQAVVHLQLFTDDRHLLSASKDRTVLTWDLESKRRITAHETHTGPLTSALLCPNQCNVYTAGMDHRLALWDLRQREATKVVHYVPAGCEAYCTCVRRSHSSQYLATGGNDQIVRLWDERLFKPICTGVGHSGTVTDCGFTSDDKQILSCGTDGCVMTWNVYT